MSKIIYSEEFEVFGRDDIYGRVGADSNVDSVGGYPLQKYHGRYVMDLTADEKDDEFRSKQNALDSNEYEGFLSSIGIKKI